MIIYCKDYYQLTYFNNLFVQLKKYYFLEKKTLGDVLIRMIKSRFHGLIGVKGCADIGGFDNGLSQDTGSWPGSSSLSQILENSEVIPENMSQGYKLPQPLSKAVFLLSVQSLQKMQTFNLAVLLLTVLLEEVVCSVRSLHKDASSSVFLNSKNLGRASNV